jgi:hypothetical protein
MLSVAVAACGERTPTALGDEAIPGEPISLEIQLPWSQFGSDAQVFGGFSAASALAEGILAKSYGSDSLEARTLLRFGSYPLTASVRDSNQVLRTDANLSIAPTGSYVVAFIDTVASVVTGPVRLALGATQTVWDPITAGWDLAADSIGDQRLWPEAGAGPVTPVTTATWERSQGDSVQFYLDSAQVSAWGDQTDETRGARIEVLTDGVRLHMSGGALRVNAKSSINPDTILILTGSAQVTFVYTPQPAAPTGELRVGGAPAWRSTMGIAVPTEINGPPELCAEVGCPFVLQPQHVSFAGLELTTRPEDVAFLPSDSMGIDVRAVLDATVLPKAPLSASLATSAAGFRIASGVFAGAAGQNVEIPITAFVKGYLAGADPSGRPPPSTIALLAASEPSTFWYASFFGPGGATEPTLRLILTVSRPMELQ